VDTEFDPVKDEANIAKHGISLSRAVELAGVVVVEDTRFEETRYRLYGTIDGIPHCAAVTIRGNILRVINLRRAHAKELRRHGW
jgi:uncharacterized DUF497 family protein